MAEIFVGRQPIYNRDLEVYAYELMPQTTQLESIENFAADKATSQVIINAFMEIGIDQLVGDKLAFIGLTEHFLESDYELPLPTDKVILKIPGYVNATPQVMRGCERLTSAGFKLALDNYLQHSSLQPLASMASIIDFNVDQLKGAEIRAHLKMLKRLNPIVLADHVKTHDEYEMCRDAGADYIQGYFLNRPRIMSWRIPRLKPDERHQPARHPAQPGHRYRYHR